MIRKNLQNCIPLGKQVVQVSGLLLHIFFHKYVSYLKYVNFIYHCGTSKKNSYSCTNIVHNLYSSFYIFLTGHLSSFLIKNIYFAKKIIVFLTMLHNLFNQVLKYVPVFNFLKLILYFLSKT